MNDIEVIVTLHSNFVLYKSDMADMKGIDITEDLAAQRWYDPLFPRWTI